jgi:RNA polymerase sigma factor (sigma-70 family)
MSEKILIQKILFGDKKAVSRLYRYYQPKLLKFVLRKVAKVEDAEEIVQDVFIDALDSLPFFQYKSSLFSWLCAIAKHNLADFYRKQKIKRIVFSRLPFLRKMADEALSPEFAYEKKQLQQKFYTTLQNLPEGFTRILRLKYIDRLSVTEIAKTLGVSYKAAESKLFRARLAFQQEFVQNHSDGQKTNQIFDSSRPA